MEKLVKILNKYVLKNVLQIFLTTIFLTTLILLSVDLFTNLDSYVQNEVSFNNIFLITFKYIPEAIMIVLPPASLFSITFFLSQMYANNEIIAVLSSGVSTRKIYKLILILMVFISFLAFVFNENIALESRISRQQLKNKVFNINYNLDNSNIGLIDSLNNNVIFANSYIEKDKALYDVVVVQKDEKGTIVQRIDSRQAIWNDEKTLWTFNKATISNIENNNIEVSQVERYEDTKINLEPNLFRNLSADMQTMLLNSAIQYLKIQEKVNLRLWYENVTDFLDRLLAPFTALIMAIIACSIDYRDKKNVFLFSIFNSIIVAVIYYVAKMLFQLTSKQAIIHPYIAVAIPYIVILLIPIVLNRIKSFSSHSNS